MSDNELWEGPFDPDDEEEDGWDGHLEDEGEDDSSGLSSDETEGRWDNSIPDRDEEAGEEPARWETPLFDEEFEPAEIPEELLVSLDAREDEADDDLEQTYHYDTQHGDGHTYDVGLALDQGLTYTPPTDPPTIPSIEDREGLDMGAGFGLSMEDSDPDAELLPERVDNSDLDLEDDVYETIRLNSETQNLTNVRVRAGDGVVALFGSVPDDEDLERLVDLIEDMDRVRMVISHLETEEGVWDAEE